MKNADTFYKDTFDYKERRQWNLLAAASRIYSGYCAGECVTVSIRESVQEACALLAEIQNLENGTEKEERKQG